MKRWIRLGAGRCALVVLSLSIGWFVVAGCDDGPSAEIDADAAETEANPPDIVEVESDASEPDAEDVAPDLPREDPADSTPEEPDADGARCDDPPPGFFGTCDGWLIDREGRRVLLRGVNVSNRRKRPPYEGGTTDADFAVMRDLGFDHIRLLWSWAAAMPEPDTLDEAYLDRLANEVARAREHGILVLVDSHQDLFGEAIRTDSGPVGNGAPVWACPEEIAGAFGEPAEPWFLNYADPAVRGCFDHLLESPELQDAFASAWAAVADRMREAPNVVGYDLWNEPYWGDTNINTWEANRLLPLYERLSSAILEVHPEAVLFVEPGLQKNVLGWTNLPRPSAPRVVFAPHLYEASMEGGDPWDGSLDYFERRLATDREEMGAWGDPPIYIGEWGTPGHYDNDLEYAVAMADLMDAESLGWAVWQWGPGPLGTYALVDAEIEPNALALSLARPYPARIAGDEVSFGIDPETGVFEVTWTADRDDLPTVIVMPTLGEYAAADAVLTGGTLMETADADRLHVVATTVGGRVTVRIEPGMNADGE